MLENKTNLKFNNTKINEEVAENYKSVQLLKYVKNLKKCSRIKERSKIENILC